MKIVVFGYIYIYGCTHVQRDVYILNRRRAALNMHISLTLLVVCRDHCVNVVGATSSWAFLALIRPYGFFSRRMVCGDYIVYCSLPHGSKVLFLAPSVAFMAALRSRC